MVLFIRGQRVMIDADLGALYGVSTRVLNQAVRRNARRFPIDFVFQLTHAEKAEVITLCDHLQNLKYSPSRSLVFTEHGAIMAASMLNTPRAIEVSVHVVRAFVKLREILDSNSELSHRLSALGLLVSSALEPAKRPRGRSHLDQSRRQTGAPPGLPAGNVC